MVARPIGLGRPILKRGLIQFGEERAADHEPAKERGAKNTPVILTKSTSV